MQSYIIYTKSDESGRHDRSKFVNLIKQALIEKTTTEKIQKALKEKEENDKKAADESRGIFRMFG